MGGGVGGGVGGAWAVRAGAVRGRCRGKLGEAWRAGGELAARLTTSLGCTPTLNSSGSPSSARLSCSSVPSAFATVKCTSAMSPVLHGCAVGSGLRSTSFSRPAGSAATLSPSTKLMRAWWRLPRGALARR